MSYVGKFWVTMADAPVFAATRASASGLSATLALLPERRYRIESSEELIQWQVVNVVSDQANYKLATTAEAEHQFFGALLAPEFPALPPCPTQKACRCLSQAN